MKILYLLAARLRRRARRPGRARPADVAARPRARGHRAGAAGDEPPGAPAIDDDAVLDFDVTANRPDCLSIVGIAREVATVYGLPLRLPAARRAGPSARRDADRRSSATPFDRPHRGARALPALRRRASPRCSVGPSPAWMQRRLHARRRPADQQRRRHHQLRAARARPADARLRPRAARRRGDRRPPRAARRAADDARRQGARRSTPRHAGHRRRRPRHRRSAASWAAPTRKCATARRASCSRARGSSRSRCGRTAKRLGLRTEASMRFERGADPTAQARGDGARLRAARDDRRRHARPARWSTPSRRRTSRASCALAHAHVEALLGMPVPADEAVRILAALGFARDAGRPPGLARRRARLASRRRPAPEDLIEEVGRHHGFEHLPATFPPVFQAPAAVGPAHRPRRRVRRAMLAAGFSESITFAFIDASGGGAVRRRRAADPPGQPAVRDLRGDAAQPAARADRRRRPQPPSRAARRPPVRDRRRPSRTTASAARSAPRGPAPRPAITGAAIGATSTSSTSTAWSTAVCARSASTRDARAGRRRRGWSPAAPPESSPAAMRSAPSGLLAPPVADAHGCRRRRRVRRRARPRSAHGAGRRAATTRVEPLPRLPVGRARRVAARARHLVCRHRS